MGNDLAQRVAAAYGPGLLPQQDVMALLRAAARSSEVRTGGFSRVARLGEKAIKIIDMGELERRFVQYAHGPRAQEMARAAATMLGRNARLLSGLRHENLATPETVGIDDDIVVLTYDWFESTIAERIAQVDSRGALDLFLQAARGLAYLHGHGMGHRDLKPKNMMVSGNRLALVDMDFAGVPGARGPAQSPTEILGGLEVYLGTKEFVPNAIYGGLREMDEVDPAAWDRNSLGRTIPHLLLDVPLEGVGIHETQLTTRVGFRQLPLRDLFSKRLGEQYAHLGDIVVSLTDELGGGYRSTDDVVVDLERLLRGEGDLVRRRPSNKRAWKRRDVTLLENPRATRRAWKQVGLGLAGGAFVLSSALGLAQGMIYLDSLDHAGHKLAKAGYAASPAEEFDSLLTKELAEDLDEEYLPHLASGAYAVFPFGKIYGAPEPLYLDGTSLDSGSFLSMLSQAGFMVQMREFAEHQRFAFADTTGDLEYPPLFGRFIAGLDPQAPTALARDAAIAAGIVLQGYDERSRGFFQQTQTLPDGMRQRFREDSGKVLTVDSEQFLLPLLVRIRDSPYASRILAADPTLWRGLPQVPRQPISPEALDRLILDSGISALQDLTTTRVRDGVVSRKVHFAARVDEQGNVLERVSRFDAEPGGDQATKSQYQAAMIYSMALRLRYLEGHPHTAPLAKGLSEMVHEYWSHVGSDGIPPERWDAPRDSAPDSLAALYFASAMQVLPDEGMDFPVGLFRERAYDAVFKNGLFRDRILWHEERPGIVENQAGYSPRMRGRFVQGDQLLVQLIKNMEKE